MSETALIAPSVREWSDFDEHVQKVVGGPLRARSIDKIQVNIGLTCDLACRHCHVESSPKRTEQMDWKTMLWVLTAAKCAGATVLDITGGAPEMNPNFCRFIEDARGQALDVMVRTNLTILLRPGYEGLLEFYRQHRVHLIASLPCYLPENVDKQRGPRVYEQSIEVIHRLNGLGYGIEPDLPLDLVYNPVGPSLPPMQSELEQEYRRELARRFGIRFTRLVTITNMPIGRFLHDLRRDGHDERYQQLLCESFNPAAVSGLMCRSQVHVGWDGRLYDCDFNYALGMPLAKSAAGGSAPSAPRHVRDLVTSALANRRIATGRHCFGCTAGQGSSCGGALV